MPSFAALTVALSLIAAPLQSQYAFGPEPRAGSSEGDSNVETSAEPATERLTDEGDDDREAAKRAFDRGLEAVSGGEFEAAVSAFERAYRLRPHPVTLFNLALALEKAGRLPEAWELFDDVLDVVESDAERREVRRHMRTIANEIAIVEVDARPRARLCIDGGPMPSNEPSGYRLAVAAGTHQLVLDDHEFVVEFAPGDRRVLLLDDADAFLDERRRGPLMPAMVGVSIGGGALALGLGIGAAVTSRDPTRTGLAAGAAGSAGIALAAGIVALLIETRKINDPSSKPETPRTECPGVDELEHRVDLQLAPIIERPIEFAAFDDPAQGRADPTFAIVPLPQTAPLPFPHPRSIAPPRRQNRPTTTTPM